MLQFEITAATRSKLGKGPSRQLRFSGKTPAILYGAGRESLPLFVDTREITRELLGLQRRHAVVSLRVEGEQQVYHVVVQALQTNPITDALEHVDFYEIDLEKPVVLDVPLHFSGTPKGVDFGGDLHMHQNKVNCKARPMDMPNAIEADISGLDIGDSFCYRDLVMPSNVLLVDAPDVVCAAVTTAAVKTEEETK